MYRNIIYKHTKNGEESMQVKYSKNKTREFIYLDDKEKRYNDIMNEYGYNFDSPHINEEMLELQAYRPKNTVNKDFFTIKR